MTKFKIAVLVIKEQNLIKCNRKFKIHFKVLQRPMEKHICYKNNRNN